MLYTEKSKRVNVDSYKYLGIIFHKSNRFTKARNTFFYIIAKSGFICIICGRFPVHITAKLRVLMYWYRLITGKQSVITISVQLTIGRY